MSSIHQKAKIKFYQPTIQELQTQKIGQIFQMLRKQQQGISSLLKKYQNYEEQDLNNVFSRKPKQSTIIKEQQKLKNHRKNLSLKKSRSKNTIVLPELLSKQTMQNQRLSAIVDRKKIRNFSTVEPAKSSLRKELEVIYNAGKKSRQISNKNQSQSSKLSKSRTKNNIQSRTTAQVESRILQQSRQKSISRTTPSMSLSLGASTILPHQNSISRPLSIHNSLQLISQNRNQQYSNQSDSEDDQIPLAYYQQQFKQKMTAQCIEQINFLYFSKNQSIKDWSESLLLMFEKHDKQIKGLRKKMKYLQKFDDKFFANDIYKIQ